MGFVKRKNLLMARREKLRIKKEECDWKEMKIWELHWIKEKKWLQMKDQSFKIRVSNDFS